MRTSSLKVRGAVGDKQVFRMEETLRAILSIEVEAKAIVNETREVVAMLKKQAKDEADRMLAQVRRKAEREAKALREKARQDAEEEKRRILMQTTQELQRLEQAGNLDEAVDYVVGVICGQEKS